MFSVAFDSESIREMALFAGVPVLFDTEIQGGMAQVGQLLTERMQEKTWEVFKAPTGKLASTIGMVQESPYAVQIKVGSPYGQRRERGFSGMTDSLGRYYANDPAKPYAQPTLDENTAEVEIILSERVQRVLDRLMGGMR